MIYKIRSSTLGLWPLYRNWEKKTSHNLETCFDLTVGEKVKRGLPEETFLEAVLIQDMQMYYFKYHLKIFLA